MTATQGHKPGCHDSCYAIRGSRGAHGRVPLLHPDLPLTSTFSLRWLPVKDDLESMSASTKSSDRGLARALSLQYSHPTWLTSRWLKRFGRQEAEALMDHNNKWVALVGGFRVGLAYGWQEAEALLDNHIVWACEQGGEGTAPHAHAPSEACCAIQSSMLQQTLPGPSVCHSCVCGCCIVRCSLSTLKCTCCSSVAAAPVAAQLPLPFRLTRRSQVLLP